MLTTSYQILRRENDTRDLASFQKNMVYTGRITVAADFHEETSSVLLYFYKSLQTIFIG